MDSLKLSVLAIVYSLLLVSCGGGGSGNNDGTGEDTGDEGGNGNLVNTNATIMGTVAGTTVIALDADNNEVASDIAEGTPKAFSLDLPVDNAYRFYFIENENTPEEKVSALYQDNTNVFSITSAQTIDLGFVDTTSGVAVPTKNPLGVEGVTSGGEIKKPPSYLNYAGTYNTITEHYDLNISDGLTLGTATIDFELTRVDNSNLILDASVNNPDEGVYTFQLPLVISDSTASIATQPYNLDGSVLLDFLLLSDGNNLVYTGIGQELNDPADISVSVANWSNDTEPVSIEDFTGTWTGIVRSDSDLSNTSDGFAITSETMTITNTTPDTIEISFGDELLTLNVNDERAVLSSVPVTLGSTIYHAFKIVTDGNGIAFYSVSAGLIDPTAIAVSMGLLGKQ
ncbi:MAG: hypothetical protein AB2598_07665 [Candidatus Thiodiazotropha sp.]